MDNGFFCSFILNISPCYVVERLHKRDGESTRIIRVNYQSYIQRRRSMNCHHKLLSRHHIQ